jgi:hypothetical protein
LIRAFLSILVLAGTLCVTAIAHAGEPAVGEADKARIQAVISAQLQAFQRDDGAAAFDFAAPAIQGIFQTPEMFMEMVRDAYRPVYRPRQVDFRDVIEIEGQPVQRVMLIGPDGRAYLAHYPMQRQPDGSWRINGCYLVPLEDKTA